MTHSACFARARFTRLALPLLAVSLIAACSDNSRDSEDTAPAPAPVAVETATPAGPAVKGREFRYTSLDCPLIRSNPDEGGFFEYECPGEGGYKLKLVEADLRQNIIVVAPDGASRSLELSALAGGRFNELGETVEWRGKVEGGTFSPDAMILRQEVVEDPDGQKEVSYLVPVRLTGRPCAVGRIAPGAGQNDQARAAADGRGACLPEPG